MKSLTRRITLKLLALGGACLGLSRTVRGDDQALTSDTDPLANSPELNTTVSWSRTHDRVWLNPRIWANPMEDWRIRDGAAECQTTGGNRNLHLITHQWTNPTGSADMRVSLQKIGGQRKDAGAGFRIGTKSELNEYRSNCFANGGINAGVLEGKLVLGRNAGSKSIDLGNETTLRLTARGLGAQVELTLIAETPSGKLLDQLTAKVQSKAVLGNVSLVNNFDAKLKKGQGGRYRFKDWSVTGNAFTIQESRQFGPILWSMYSLSDSRSDEGFVLKISALTGPLGKQDNQNIELQVKVDGDWKSLGQAALDTDAWTATFRIPNWNEKAATPYRLLYRELKTDGTEEESNWSGTIKANPAGRPLRIGALTCQNHYGFPYEPVAENIVRLDPDLIYFSGDQLYESHGGYGLIRDPAEPAILNYLRKYYMFGWSFREAMRDRPTICIADDHDVFQGNIWGEDGAPMDVQTGGASSNGGYREPARMVNVVHKTNTAHHPDFHDPTPVQQGISVYYGDMVYGDVGFAILGDRQFKSGPQHVDTGSGRADHVKDQNFQTSVLDKQGLHLLGSRQESFLKEWGKDWRGHKMKILLSQTVFAGVATHHGKYDGYLKADLDSGGWPQTPRNRAIDILRESKALHINGDQHLTTLSQYGVDKQRDSMWSFCTPAIAAGYPRWWRPDEVGMPHQKRPTHGLENTGEYLDGFGNMIYVYAVGNPEVGTKKNRYEKAHQKGSGFGVVTVDTDEKTYQIDCFRFLIDAGDGKPENQFTGWPVTIRQQENAGDNIIG
ncbi:MAG: alkaline phosphatase D family protein [Rubripirellula sp.]